MGRSRHAEAHRSLRGGWLRPAVLGANDGLLSTAALVVGVATATDGAQEAVTAGVVGLVAGALSMGAGEYVSVSSQRDAEEADRAAEERELAEHPDEELDELVAIYESRGLSAELARRVAVELTQRDALDAHVRDEIGLDDERRARPMQAALTSAMSFVCGAIIPVLAVALAGSLRVPTTIAVTLVGLAALGWLGASLGGAPPLRPAFRVLVWGAAAMAVSVALGSLIGAAI
ncbi:MAG: VIT1/CCC1 transporter family protein [Miltoncostaeaceae bacterium]